MHFTTRRITVDQVRQEMKALLGTPQVQDGFTFRSVLPRFDKIWEGTEAHLVQKEKHLPPSAKTLRRRDPGSASHPAHEAYAGRFWREIKGEGPDVKDLLRDLLENPDLILPDHRHGKTSNSIVAVKTADGRIGWDFGGYITAGYEAIVYLPPDVKLRRVDTIYPVDASQYNGYVQERIKKWIAKGKQGTPSF